MTSDKLVISGAAQSASQAVGEKGQSIVLADGLARLMQKGTVGTALRDGAQHCELTRNGGIFGIPIPHSIA